MRTTKTNTKPVGVSAKPGWRKFCSKYAEASAVSTASALSLFLGTMPPAEYANLNNSFACREVNGDINKYVFNPATLLSDADVEADAGAGIAEQAQFYMDVQAHIDDPTMQNAMEELRFYCSKDEVHVLGTYPASPSRS